MSLRCGSLAPRWCSLSLRWCSFMFCDRKSTTGHIVGRFTLAPHLQQPHIAHYAQFCARLQGIIHLISFSLPPNVVKNLSIICEIHRSLNGMVTTKKLLSKSRERRCFVGKAHMAVINDKCLFTFVAYKHDFGTDTDSAHAESEWAASRCILYLSRNILVLNFMTFRLHAL